MNTYSAATKDFLLHCEIEKKLSPKTIKAYKTDLFQLELFLNEVNHSQQICEITKSELREYLARISILKSKSIKRKIASLKAFFNYLEFDDVIPINPFRKMKIKIKEEKVIPKVMDIDEVFRIFKVVYQSKSHNNIFNFKYLESLRNIVIVELLFATGIRVSELISLKDDIIDLNTGNIVVKGKGNKERIVQICNTETIEILKSYREIAYEKILAAGGYFLVNRFKRKISDQSVRRIIKYYANMAGIFKKITPHTFRHSFATLLLEKNVDIKYIQSFLGHSSIVTTQIYTQVNRKKQTEILKSKHPRIDFSFKNSLNDG